MVMIKQCDKCGCETNLIKSYYYNKQYLGDCLVVPCLGKSCQNKFYITKDFIIKKIETLSNYVSSY